MRQFITRFIKVCPKSGKFRGVKNLSGLSRLLLPLIGLAALIWILIRVIPKPSRLNYPCVKAAMPFATGFLGYIFIFVLSIAAFIRSKKSYVYFPLFILALFSTFGISGSSVINNIQLPTLLLEANQPMGEAKGIFPGRVVWIYDPDATNMNWNRNVTGDGWFLSKNNDQAVIDMMLSDAIQSLTGRGNDSVAWNMIFSYYNKNKGKGEVYYNANEKIFIKTNATSSWSGNFKTNDLSKVSNNYFNTSETSPHLVLSVLRHLVNIVKVPQDKIYIGDPMKHIYKHCYDLWHNEFPNVHYLDYSYSTLGREKVVASKTALIHYSDDGKILRTNVWNNNEPGDDPVTQDYFYTIMDEAEYMINIPTLKGHKRAGMTAFAKNHFGSHTRESAAHLHNGLIAPTEMPNISRPGYGLYRVLVDIMGHKITGEKNLIYLMDALWATDHELDYPLKWEMAPFNNDYMSSIFISQDPVAIESVGYDFLRSEFTAQRGAGTYVQMEGVDDYLHQAADSVNWPADVVYTPSGERIGSLGTHEHWNNEADRQYTRNLETGLGIELIASSPNVYVEKNNLQVPGKFVLYANYPNPFNPSTKIKFSLKEKRGISLFVFDAEGKLVTEILKDEYKPAGEYEVEFNGDNLPSGVYYYQLKSGNISISNKMILMK